MLFNTYTSYFLRLLSNSLNNIFFSVDFTDEIYRLDEKGVSDENLIILSASSNMQEFDHYISHSSLEDFIVMIINDSVKTVIQAKKHIIISEIVQFYSDSIGRPLNLLKFSEKGLELQIFNDKGFENRVNIIHVRENN